MIKRVFSFSVAFLGIMIVSMSSLLGQYSLDSCKQLSLHSNVSYQNALLEIQSAKMTKNAAFTKFFPSVSATGFAFQSNKSMIDLDVNDLAENIHISDAQLSDIWTTLYMNYGDYLSGIGFQMIDNGLMVGVTAMQPIFAGGRIVNGNKLANLGITAAEYQIELAHDDLILKTEQSYWLIVSLQEKLKTVQSVNVLLDTLFNQVTMANISGITIKNDILKVKLKQNEMASNLLKLNNGIRLAKMALCQQMGVDYNDSLTLTDSVGALKDPYVYKKDHSSFLSQRTEHKLLNLSVEAESLKKKMIVGETLPQLGIGGLYSVNNILGSFHSNWTVFATVSIPITSWWEGSYNIKKQDLCRQIAQNNCNDLSEKLLLQMQQAWDGVEETYKQTLLSLESIEEAEDNVSLNKDFYQAGTVTISDLLEAHSLLQSAKDQYVDYYTQYLVKLRQYLQMTNQDE